MTERNYQKLESRLSHLLNLSAFTFKKSELDEVRRYLDACEYGLALETFVDIVKEENRQVSGDAASVVYELVDSMGLARQDFERKLKGHVLGE